MTKETAKLNDQIFDALDECFNLNVRSYYGKGVDKQTFLDAFGEKLDEILNSK